MKIAVSIGHTLIGVGSGAVGILNESQCTREVGLLVKAYLEQLGHQVVFCRIDTTTKKGEDLAYRVNLANSNNVDLFLEIHLNSGDGHGTEIFTYGGKQLDEAKRILNEICSLGFANRGIKDGSHLYVVRNTKAKAMLIECCFVDSQEDANRYNPDSIAKAIVKGLVGQVPESAEDKIERIVNSMDIKDVQHICNVLGIKDYEGKTLIVDNLNGKRTESARQKLKEILTYIMK